MATIKSSKQTKKQEELQKASEALYYEIMMLNNCASTFYECSKGKILLSEFTKNILIESFCVHLRNLIEFFEQKSKDRITYEYFMPENLKIKYLHSLNLKYSEKVNNLLSHLTFHRQECDKNWDLIQITNEVNENIFNFFKEADKKLLCKKVIEYIKALKSGDTKIYNHYTCTTSDAILPSRTITRFSI